VYRGTGEKNAFRSVCFNHLTAVLDDWDPRTIDSLAQHHRVSAFNNRGVGGSKGLTPDTIDNMARMQWVSFELFRAFEDLPAWLLTRWFHRSSHPRKNIPISCANDSSSTSGRPAAKGSACGLRVAERMARATPGEEASEAVRSFFTQSHRRQKAAAEFLQRLGTRQQDRDCLATQETIVAQVTAIYRVGAWR